MELTEIASYDDKVEHVKVVADRGVQARKLGEDAGQRSSRRQARKVFKAMAVTRMQADSMHGTSILVFSDTPQDRSHGVSKAWARHVQNVFVASFVAGEPKPKLPTN